MVANSYRYREWQFSLILVSLLGLPLEASQPKSIVIEVSEPARVQLIAEGDLLTNPEQTFVITHGCGGTVPGDRFHRLATVIKQRMPKANVLRLDWTVGAHKTTWFGLPDPWFAAGNIKPTGVAGAELLQRLGVDPSTVTLIGESFGVYVNHIIAEHLGAVLGVLAFNPASELGGFVPPVLQNDAERVCVFTTSSAFDTKIYLSTWAVNLVTEPDAAPLDQHCYGIMWLCRRLEANDSAWLHLEYQIRKSDRIYLSGEVSANGIYNPLLIPRVPPARTEVSIMPQPTTAQVAGT